MRYIIANWKMNKNLQEAQQWVEEFNQLGTYNQDTKAIICPSAPLLNILKDTNLDLCAQLISKEEKGPFTGQISVNQVKDFCSYVLIGHSETKDQESDMIAKIELCLAHKITPVICIQKIEQTTRLYRENSILIWEDQENISHNGVFNVKNPEEIAKGISEIKNMIGSNSTVLYGGSVNEENAPQLANIAQLDGVIIGNASLDAKKFYKIITYF